MSDIIKGTHFYADFYYWEKSNLDYRGVDKIDLIDKFDTRKPFSFRATFTLLKDTVVMIKNNPYKIVDIIPEVVLKDVEFKCSSFCCKLYVKNILSGKFNGTGFEIRLINKNYYVHAKNSKYTIYNISEYVIPTKDQDLFYSAIKLENQELKQITTDNPSMFLYNRRSWKYFGLTSFVDQRDYFVATVSGDKNVFSFVDDTSVISLKVTDQKIKKNKEKLKELEKKDFTDASVFGEYLEIFEFYKKARFNTQLRTTTTFCKLFCNFSTKHKKELLENDQFDANKRLKIEYTINNIKNKLLLEMDKVKQQALLLSEFKIFDPKYLDAYNAILISMLEKYESKFDYYTEKCWENIKRGKSNLGGIIHQIAIGAKKDKTADITETEIREYKKYSSDLLDEFKKLIERILTNEIWSVDKCRVLRNAILHFITDFESKKATIANPTEIKNMMDFKLQMQIHLNRLNLRLGKDVVDLEQYRTRISIWEKNQFKKSTK